MSPHYKMFGREFKGPRIPFGAQVMYKPSPIYEKKLKADGKEKWSNARPGLFLGYKVLSGGRWRDALFVADLEDLAHQDLSYYARSTMKKTHVQTVRKNEVIWDPKTDPITFPMYPDYHKANMTVYGIRNSKAAYNQQMMRTYMKAQHEAAQ